MKIIITIILLGASLFGGSNWNYDVIAEKGWKVEIVCKNGYLTEVFVLPNGGKFEESHCYNKSSWDGECNHPPVQCSNKESK